METLGLKGAASDRAESSAGCAEANSSNTCGRVERAAPNGFDWAIKVLKNGHVVRREGWNGRGMCIYMNKGSMDFKPEDTIPPRIEGIPRGLFEIGDSGTTTRLPNINMRTASGSTLTGWLASQSDMLAEDWVFA